MPVYSLRQTGDLNLPQGVNWELVGSGTLTALGAVLTVLGLVRRNPVPAVPGVVMAAGGSYLVYRELREAADEEEPEEPPPPPERSFEIIADRYASPQGWAQWEAT